MIIYYFMIDNIINYFYNIYSKSNIINGLNNTSKDFNLLRNKLNNYSSYLFNNKDIQTYDLFTNIDIILTDISFVNNEILFKENLKNILLKINNLNKLYNIIFDINDNNKNNKNKNKKQNIPAIIKKLVWNTYIGEDIGKAKCFCCNIIDITQLNFICGHYISEYNGGKIEINNLRPICLSCNLSMGKKNMDEFINNYFNN